MKDLCDPGIGTGHQDTSVLAPGVKGGCWQAAAKQSSCWFSSSFFSGETHNDTRRVRRRSENSESAFCTGLQRATSHHAEFPVTGLSSRKACRSRCPISSRIRSVRSAHAARSSRSTRLADVAVTSTGDAAIYSGPEFPAEILPRFRFELADLGTCNSRPRVWPCEATVSFRNFKSQNFKLSVSNPKNK